MAELNHTIICAQDNKVSASFIADLLDLEVGDPVGPFLPVQLANGVQLDYMNRDEVQPQHYAFLVDDAEFDTAYQRLQDAGVPTYADPGFTQAGEINHECGGRGVYFPDPSGHYMELLTRASS